MSLVRLPKMTEEQRQFKAASVPMGMLASRVAGQAVSPAQLQQAQMLSQAMAARGGAVPAGMNPALAAAMRNRQVSSQSVNTLGQLGGARADEQAATRRALMEAMVRRREAQMQQAAWRMGLQKQDVAADLAQKGALMSGLTGLAGAGALGLSKLGGGPAMKDQNPGQFIGPPLPPMADQNPGQFVGPPIPPGYGSGAMDFSGQPGFLGPGFTI